MFKIIVVLAVLSGLLSGCLEQDAFRDQNENVKQGVPPGQKIGDDRSHVSKDFMTLRMEPEIGVFTEGVESSVKLIAKLNGIVADIKVDVKNLPDDATYDPSSGHITWTPDSDSVLRRDFFTEHNLIVTMTALGKEKVVLTENFKFLIYRNLEWRPEIITPLAAIPPVKEDTQGVFKVRVRDLDSVDVNMSITRPPRLSIISVPGVERDGSSFVRVEDGPTQVDAVADPYLWEFSMRVDLRGKEVTHNRDDFKFGLLATSHLGLASEDVSGTVSEPFIAQFRAITIVPKPQITWSEDAVFVEGESRTFGFSVFSPVARFWSSGAPVADGKIQSVGNFQSECESVLPGGASCECTNLDTWKANCTITWKGQTGTGSQSQWQIRFTATNFNDITGESTNRLFKKTVRVIKRTNP